MDGAEAMKIIETVDLGVISQHEKKTGANVTLGGYHMDRCCPLAEFQLLRCVLELDDIERLFVLNDFAKFTAGSCRLKSVLSDAASNQRVAAFSNGRVDLRKAPNLELLIVSANADDGPLLIIDGNHRAIWQYLAYSSIHAVPAFICVHSRINEWGYMPIAAR